jgi:hypothetical protein
MCEQVRTANNRTHDDRAPCLFISEQSSFFFDQLTNQYSDGGEAHMVAALPWRRLMKPGSGGGVLDFAAAFGF